MAESNEKFVGGMRVTRHEKAPDFVLASIGVNIGDFIVWANKHNTRGWVNFQIKKSKGGKLYAELDTWEKKPNPNMGEVERPLEDNTTSPGVDGEVINLDDIPFD